MQANLVTKRARSLRSTSLGLEERRLTPIGSMRARCGRRVGVETLRKAAPSIHNQNPKHTQTEIVLDRAEEDLRELCTSEETSAESWKALDYLVSKRRKFSERCDLEDDNGPHEPASCESLVRLGDFARELMATGSINNFRDNLLIMQRAEQRHAAAAAMVGQAPAAAGAAGAPGQPQPATLTAEELHERAELVRFFHRLDTNKDGEICMLELLDGLEALGAVLTDNDIQQIHDALAASDGEGLDNGRNRLDVDDFLSVCAASPVLRGVAVGAGNPNFLRHAAQMHGHHHTATGGHGGHGGHSRH